MAFRPADAAIPPILTIGRIVLVFVALIVCAGLVAGAVWTMWPPEDLRMWAFLAVVGGEGIGALAGVELTGWTLRVILRHLRLPRAVLPWLLMIAVGTWLLDGGVLSLLREYLPSTPDEELSALFDFSTAGELVVVFVTIAIAGPIVEELFVRGVLLRAFALRWGLRVGVVASAIVFGVLHANPLQTPLTLVSGLVWALVLVRTGSFGAPLLLHMLNNGGAVVAMVVTRASGVEDLPTVAPAIDVFLTAGAIVIGVTLIVAAFRRLPRDPDGLAAFWAVPKDLIRIGWRADARDRGVSAQSAGRRIDDEANSDEAIPLRLRADLAKRCLGP